MSITKSEGSARDRLLAAADELFYEEGVHTVGIERVLERAGVAKASLYSTFGSKDALVRAYLEGRAERRRTRVMDRISRYDDPRDRILAVFDLLAESSANPKYRGCAFVNASAEEPDIDTTVRKASATSRAWLRDLFVELAGDLGVGEPKLLGRQLGLLYDGATVGAAMERDPTVAAEARAMVELLLDAHEEKGNKPRRTKRAR